MKPLFLLSFVFVILLSGCATPKQYAITGGSKAEGMVVMSYDHGFFERPEVDEGSAFVTASNQCEQWGYRGAEKDAIREQKCLEKNAHGDCMQTRRITRFDCIGADMQARKKKPAKVQARQLSQSVKYLYYAEQAAKSAGCMNPLEPESIEPHKEIYSTACRSRKVFVVCNREQCETQ